MIRTGGKENKRIGPFMKQQATIKPNRLKAELRTKPLRVGMISLGCAKNLVDAEIMLGSLLKEGIEIKAWIQFWNLRNCARPGIVARD